MSVVIERIDGPCVTGAVMRLVTDPIEHRVAQVDVRRGHVDPGSQDVRAVAKLAGAHPAKQIETFLGGAAAVGTLLPRFRERAAMSTDLVGAQAVDIGLAPTNQ